MIENPLDTFVCKRYNTTGFEEAIQRYLVSMRDPIDSLSYQVLPINSVTPVFITGKNETEQMLPLIGDHPLVFETYSGQKLIVMDVRQYVKNINKEFVSTIDIAIRKEVMEFIVNRAIFTMLFFSDDTRGGFNPVLDRVILSFAYWLSDSITNVYLLDSIEKIKTLVVVTHYYVRVVYEHVIPDNYDDSFDVFKTLNLTKRDGSNKEFVSSLLSTLNKEPKGIKDLVANLKTGVESPKTDGINVPDLLNIVSKSGYITGNEIFGVALEHPGTWLAILTTVLNTRGYNSTKAGKIIMKHKKVIDTPSLLTFLETKLGQYKV